MARVFAKLQKRLLNVFFNVIRKCVERLLEALGQIQLHKTPLISQEGYQAVCIRCGFAISGFRIEVPYKNLNTFDKVV